MRDGAMIAALVLALSGIAAATGRDDFLLKDTQDLVDLCTVGAKEDLNQEAIHFCQGFAVGVYRTIVAVTTDRGRKPIFCPPDPLLTRDAAIQAFVDWSRGNPDVLSKNPVDGLTQFMVTKWPCAKPKAAKE
ncbi:MAG: Rap1a/Tai family immunity protein [Candidatus Binatia bacterium]